MRKIRPAPAIINRPGRRNGRKYDPAQPGRKIISNDGEEQMG